MIVNNHRASQRFVAEYLLCPLQVDLSPRLAHHACTVRSVRVRSVRGLVVRRVLLAIALWLPLARSQESSRGEHQLTPTMIAADERERSPLGLGGTRRLAMEGFVLLSPLLVSLASAVVP